MINLTIYIFLLPCLTQVKLILVRLDILQTRDTSLDNHSGDIEKYLDSFCTWQKNKNPGGNTRKVIY